MTENIRKLAGLFDGINKEISMDEFEDKLEVQKITYIAQENGLDLGYDFEWYLRGPYCKQVSIDAHTVIDNKITHSPQEAGLDAEQVRQFAAKLQPYINDSEWLEIAGSLLYLRNEHYSGRQIEEVIGYMLEDLTYGYKNFSEALVRRVLADMLRSRLIQ